MIRPLKSNELPGLAKMAGEFFASSRHLQGFNLPTFVASWSAFIDSGAGVIFVATDGDQPIGALGGVKFPDPNNGKAIASELFWFVTPEARESGKGLALLGAFEGWAKSNGCQQIIMVYLVDLMPAKVRGIYESRGYQPMEVHYTKEI